MTMTRRGFAAGALAAGALADTYGAQSWFARVTATMPGLRFAE